MNPHVKDVHSTPKVRRQNPIPIQPFIPSMLSLRQIEAQNMSIVDVLETPKDILHDFVQKIIQDAWDNPWFYFGFLRWNSMVCEAGYNLKKVRPV